MSNPRSSEAWKQTHINKMVRYYITHGTLIQWTIWSNSVYDKIHATYTAHACLKRQVFRFYRGSSTPKFKRVSIPCSRCSYCKTVVTKSLTLWNYKEVLITWIKWAGTNMESNVQWLCSNIRNTANAFLDPSTTTTIYRHISGPPHSKEKTLMLTTIHRQVNVWMFTNSTFYTNMASEISKYNFAKKYER